MNRATTYRWAAVTTAAAAGLAVLTALAAPLATSAPASPATTMPATATPATTRPAPATVPRPTVDRSVAAAAQAAAAAAPPVVVSTRPKAMASAFDAVLDRSIFLKGEQRIGRSRDDGPRTFSPSVPPRPQASLVFRGFTQVGDDRTDAMIEDTNANKIFSVRTGELLAGGRVVGITFDELDYQFGGKVTPIALGQTLEGQAAAAGSTAPPTTAASPGGPVDTAPALGTTAGLSAEDILARMKKRRQMEMGGK